MPSVELNLKTILENYKCDLEAALEEVLSEEKNSNFTKTKLLESIRYSVLGGGKRLRAILALLTAEAVLKHKEQISLGQNPAQGLALALELVHAGSLIHDDLPCMDNDDLRRGKPTNHIAYGEDIALLAGDFLLCYPIEILLAKTPEKYSQNLQRIISEFVNAINSMIAGQAMDIEFAKTNSQNLRIEDLELMQSLKTGALLRIAVVLAAKLANAEPRQIEALELYAKNLGLAFQIADDILDYTSSPEELGKKVNKDLEQNKLTFVKLYGMEEAKLIAKQLITEAKESISQVELYADKLLAVGDYVISRTN